MENKDIIYIVIDSLRADVLDDLSESDIPTITNLIEKPSSEQYSSCISQGRWTPASTGSILTGTYLSRHLVTGPGTEVAPLNEKWDTLPTLLSQQGYRTIGISGNNYISDTTGLSRGFDSFTLAQPSDLRRDFGIPTLVKYGIRQWSVGGGFSREQQRHNLSYFLTQKSIKELNKPNEAPVFLYAHFNNTHWPYAPPPKFAKRACRNENMSWRRAIQISLDVFDEMYKYVANGLELSEDQWKAIKLVYYGEIMFVDYLLGKLLDNHENSDERVVIMTGDHGELFGERGWLGHHCIIHPKLVHVPLIMDGLGSLVIESDNVVQHIDVTRTLAEKIGATSQQFQGTNLETSIPEVGISERAPVGDDKDTILRYNAEYDFSDAHEGEVKLGLQDDLLLKTGDWEVLQSWPQAEEIRDSHLRDEIKASIRQKTNGESVVYCDEESGFDQESLDRLQDLGYV